MQFVSPLTPRERLRQGTFPWVETYWESYLSSGYDLGNCNPASNLDPYPVDSSIYGFDLSTLPVGGVDGPGAHVVNIAFASQNTAT